MDGARRHLRFRLRLTPLGWVLSVAAITLVILAIVTASAPIIVALIVVILIWALVLQSRFPFGAPRGTYYTDPDTTDYGREAADEFERKYGHRF